MSSKRTQAEIRRTSANLRRLLTGLLATLAVLLVLERFGAVAVQLLNHGVSGETLRRLGLGFAAACPEVLFLLALWWIRTDNPRLLDFHYGLSLIGVIFEIYFLTLQVFVIKAVCIWCTLYGLSLIARFAVAMAIWLRRGKASERFRQ